MKKADIIIIASILSVALAVFAVFSFTKTSGSRVIIKQNNEIVYEGNLSNDTTVKLSDNTAVVKDGFAYMESADCKNQICVHTGKISKKGESIICLPNKVIIEIK